MDLIVHNARLACDAPLTDIGVENGRTFRRCALEPGRNAQAVTRVSAIKPSMTLEDIVARARAALERCIENGATRMRPHVEVDPRIGLRGFEGVRQLARD